MNPAFVPIQESLELQKLKSFLQRNKLPFEDIKSTGNLFLGSYDDEGDIIASGGLELYGASALLRSVAVKEEMRGKNLGKKIVDHLVQQARDKQIETLYLLTETAHDFFLKKGFVDVPRDSVPEDVKSSSEFSFVCPTSAKCMALRIE